MPVLISHLWQLKTVAFLHWCLISAVLFGWLKPYTKKKFTDVKVMSSHLVARLCSYFILFKRTLLTLNWKLFFRFSYSKNYYFFTQTILVIVYRPWDYAIKIFTAVNTSVPYKDSVFVIVSHCDPSLIFQAWPLPWMEYLRGHCKGRLYPSLEIFTLTNALAYYGS